MRRRSMVAVVGLVMAGALVAGQSASAATMVGNSCAGEAPAETYAGIQLANDPTDPLPATIPSKGVITSWTLNDALPIPPTILINEQLKVFRATSTPKQFTVVGESAPSLTNFGLNTFSTRVPVEAGDFIGLGGSANVSGEIFPVFFLCQTKKTGDLIGAFMTPVPPGSSQSPTLELPGYALPLTVSVEPDADGDGYGDETQDKCPTNASTQAACPVPPAPISLSATSAAQKGLVTVTLTASAQASVTVGGTVKLGKAGTANLSGGTQTVTPGTLAKFVVLFPSKLKAQLKKTPPSKKLTLSLSASAPGVTSTALTVKVKGQKKPKKHHAKA
jgi:hypothetical protein